MSDVFTVGSKLRITTVRQDEAARQRPNHRWLQGEWPGPIGRQGLACMPCTTPSSVCFTYRFIVPVLTVLLMARAPILRRIVA